MQITGLEPQSVHCPYCGEIIEILIDCSIGSQSYIEDCQVCCCPINIEVYVDEQSLTVLAKHENE